MKDFFPKIENFRYSRILSLIIIAFVFIIDISTPLGYSICLLYSIPLLMLSYKAGKNNLIYSYAVLITILTWVDYFAGTPVISIHVEFINRLIITISLWIITYVQVQRGSTIRALIKSEENLKKSEDRFRITQELSPDGFTLMKPFFDENGNLVDFIFTYENMAVAKMNGTNSEEVIGKRLLELFPGHEDTQFFNTYKKVYETKRAVEFEDHYKGETIVKDKWFRIVSVPTTDGIAVLAQDITERKFAEKAIMESEASLNLAQKLIHIGSFRIDYVTNSFDYSEELCRIFGFDPGEKSFTYEKAVRRIHPDDYHYVMEEYRKSIDERTSLDLDFRIITPDSQMKYVHVKREPDFDGDGKLAGAFGIVMDITERKYIQLKLEEMLKQFQESEAKLLEAQRLAHMCSFIFNFEENSFEWTEEFYNIYEIAAGKKFNSIAEMMEFVHPDDRDYVRISVKKAIDEMAETLQMEYRIITGLGNLKYLNYRGRLFFNDQGQHTKRFGTIIDVTERKLYEIELKKTLEELRRSNVELEQFAYVASHDLQEPIRMINNYTEILRRRSFEKLNNEEKEFFRFISEGAVRMHQLVNALLQYSRLSSKGKEFENVDCNEVLSDVFKDLKITIENYKAKITCEELPVVKGDKTMLRQLFQNLLHNAIKFGDSRDPEVSISSERKDEYWMIKIRDNGIGIAPEYHDKIFIIFQKLHTKDKYPGTGIGLAVCKKIVELHGGKISVDSVVGEGTTFYFTLPM